MGAFLEPWRCDLFQLWVHSVCKDQQAVEVDEVPSLVPQVDPSRYDQWPVWKNSPVERKNQIYLEVSKVNFTNENKKKKKLKLPWRHHQQLTECHIDPRDRKTSQPARGSPKEKKKDPNMRKIIILLNLVHQLIKYRNELTLVNVNLIDICEVVRRTWT